MKKTFWSSLLLATALSTTANAQSIFEAGAAGLFALD